MFPVDGAIVDAQPRDGRRGFSNRLHDQNYSINERETNMLRFTGLFSLTLVMMSLVGCATTRIMSDYDPDINFLKYKGFDWLADVDQVESTNAVDNALVNKRVKRIVNQELGYKGYQLDISSPSFYVSYQISVREREFGVYRDYGCFYDGHHGHHGHHYFGYPYSGGYRRYVYDETTITIDVIDVETKELVWRGWTYDRSYGPYLSETTTRKAVRKILSEFPPNSSEK